LAVELRGDLKRVMNNFNVALQMFFTGIEEITQRLDSIESSKSKNGVAKKTVKKVNKR
jgi:prefoldin subunit 5